MPAHGQGWLNPASFSAHRPWISERGVVMLAGLALTGLFATAVVAALHGNWSLAGASAGAMLLDAALLLRALDSAAAGAE